ncbi:hypothetical protein E4U21_002902 [Claviceps maximensis]|nr:hypothetical protein E4U21_002902 [Claviceps maximensis]
MTHLFHSSSRCFERRRGEYAKAQLQFLTARTKNLYQAFIIRWTLDGDQFHHGSRTGTSFHLPSLQWLDRRSVLRNTSHRRSRSTFLHVVQRGSGSSSGSGSGSGGSGSGRGSQPSTQEMEGAAQPSPAGRGQASGKHDQDHDQEQDHDHDQTASPFEIRRRRSNMTKSGAASRVTVHPAPHPIPVILAAAADCHVDPIRLLALSHCAD